MKGSELVKKLKRFAKKRGLVIVLDGSRGRGSHSTLYLGNQFTIIRNLKDELKTGTLQGMLKQLDITLDDLENNDD